MQHLFPLFQNMIDLSTTTPIQDASVYQFPLDLVSQILQEVVILFFSLHDQTCILSPFYHQRAVGVLFSPMVLGWAGGWAEGKSLSRLYLRNCKVYKVDT